MREVQPCGVKANVLSATSILSTNLGTSSAEHLMSSDSLIDEQVPSLPTESKFDLRTSSRGFPISFVQATDSILKKSKAQDFLKPKKEGEQCPFSDFMSRRNQHDATCEPHTFASASKESIEICQIDKAYDRDVLLSPQEEEITPRKAIKHLSQFGTYLESSDSLEVLTDSATDTDVPSSPSESSNQNKEKVDKPEGSHHFSRQAVTRRREHRKLERKQYILGSDAMQSAEKDVEEVNNSHVSQMLRKDLIDSKTISKVMDELDDMIAKRRVELRKRVIPFPLIGEDGFTKSKYQSSVISMKRMGQYFMTESECNESSPCKCDGISPSMSQIRNQQKSATSQRVNEPTMFCGRITNSSQEDTSIFKEKSTGPVSSNKTESSYSVGCAISGCFARS